MKPAELFGVAVRTIGLLVVLGSVFLFLVATLLLLGSRGPVLEGYLLGLAGLFVGIYFLSGAEALLNAVYPKES